MFDKIDQHSDALALISHQGDVLTYAQLIDRADRIGSHVKQRSLVVMICTNTVESICGYVGILRSDAVVLLLNETLDRALVGQLIKNYRPEFLYSPKSYALNPDEGRVVKTFGRYILYQTSEPPKINLHPELSLLMTTSGTTGSPKVVRLAKRNLISNTISIVNYLDIKKVDRAITTMPMSYSYGLSIINTHLHRGASIIVSDKTLLERGFWEIWEQGKPSSFSGVPYLYDLLMKLDFENKVLPGLRYLTQAGGQLPTRIKTKIVRSCKRNGVKFYCMYGQTEAAPRMGYLPWENVEKAGCIGIPVPSGRFWLVDDTGTVIDSDDVVGELVYQGPNVSLGYAESAEDLSRADENRGVLMTGDLAKRDREGFYYLVGRKSRFVKLYGNRIDLDSLETLISSNDCDCACVAKGEKLRIFLTEQPCHHTVNEILKRLGIHQKAVEILEIQKIPRNQFGKTSYSQLQ